MYDGEEDMFEHIVRNRSWHRLGEGAGDEGGLLHVQGMGFMQNLMRNQMNLET
jgi:hypothetical protein